VIRIGKVVWPGPVGIGAGIIKGTAAFVDFASKADSIEVGSITINMREGNSGQTVWKYSQELALRHNAGLPNPGAVEIVNQLKEAQYKIAVPWGLNVAVTPGISDIKTAADDISQCVETVLKGGLKPDWLTLNISSPDTSDRVDMLGEPLRVQALIQAIRATLKKVSMMTPVWVKVAPSLSKEHYAELGKVMITEKIDAIIATNTLADPQGEPGGWCGKPLTAHSRSVIWQMKEATQNLIPIVGVGGINSGEEVEKTIEAGALAVQIVSATLFRGRDAALTIRREYETLSAREAQIDINKSSEN